MNEMKNERMNESNETRAFSFLLYSRPQGGYIMSNLGDYNDEGSIWTQYQANNTT
jgi:hypothetical protein